MIKKMFDSMKVWGKLTMICCSFSIPILVLLYLMVSGINSDIQVATLETYGDDYQKPLYDLLRALPDGQFTANRYLTERTPKLKDRLDALDTQIDKGFADLEQADRSRGADLQFTDEGLYKRKRLHFKAATVKGEWQELKKALAEGKLSASASDEKYWHLVADIRMMITHMGDTSNLILDPDLDTYYNMSATLLGFPQTQERLAHIRDEVWHMLKSGNLSQGDRIKVATFGALLKESDVDANNTYVTTALTEDPNFHGVCTTFQAAIPPALKAYNENTQPLLDALAKIVKDPAGVSAEDFLNKAELAIGAANAFWDKDIVEEDNLLNMRIRDFEHKKTTYLISTAIAVLVSLFLAFLITGSITEPLDKCVNALKAQADMDFSKKLDLQRTDELGQMAGGVNKVADNMRTTMQDILKSSQSLSDSAQSWASASMDMAKDSNNAVVKAMVDSIKTVAKNAAELQRLGGKFKF